jgi:integrase
VAEDGTEAEEPDLVGLRDRALIGVMAYTFARINAVIQMKVRDYFVLGRRGWVRLTKKAARSTSCPATITWKNSDAYIAAAGIAGDPDGPLFHTTGRKTGHQQPMWQQDA